MIQSLSYIGIASPNAAAWPEFATSILGAEVAEPGADGTVRLRVDDAAARIYIHPGERNDLAYLGWAVAQNPDFAHSRHALGAEVVAK